MVSFEQFLASKRMRLIERDEIVIDLDIVGEQGARCLNETGLRLYEVGYCFEWWYAVRQKNPHLHIRHIPFIAELPDEALKEYKRLFLQKYVPRVFWNEKVPDYSLCGKHPIAEEDKPHFKYNTPKLLRTTFNPDKSNFCEVELYKQAQRKGVDADLYKKQFINNTATLSARIASRLSIISLADAYGLEPKGKKMRGCPFHSDGSPSLSLEDTRGLFHCFGCNSSGNIIIFYAMLKKLNPKITIDAIKSAIKPA